jgi:hypothetical protein
MAGRGYPVLSDDVAAMVERAGGSWSAEPGYPRLRLWSAALGAIDASAAREADGGPVITGPDKRYLVLSSSGDGGAWRFQPEPLPVGAIYELQRAPDRRSPVVTPIAGAERVTTLVRHAREPLAPLDAPARADEFARVSRLAASVPVRRLACPDDLEALDTVCQTLVDDATSWALQR